MKYNKESFSGRESEAVIWIANELAEANRLKRLELRSLGKYDNDSVYSGELEDKA